MKRFVKMETNGRLDNQIFNIIEEIEDIIDTFEDESEDEDDSADADIVPGLYN